MDKTEATIAPEPGDSVRTAILEALSGEDDPPGGWSATALVEGVLGPDEE